MEEKQKYNIQTVRYDDGEFILLLNGEMVGKPIRSGLAQEIESWFRSYLEEKYD